MKPRDGAMRIRAQSAIQASLKERKQSNPDLCHLLQGHRLHFELRALDGSVRAAHRVLHKPPQMHTINAMLIRQGWAMTHRWTWHHSEIAKTISLCKTGAHFTQCLASLRHRLREAWRCHCYNQWQQSGRIDANKCQHIQYDSARCKLAPDAPSHSFANFGLVTGAFFCIPIRHGASAMIIVAIWAVHASTPCTSLAAS